MLLQITSLSGEAARLFFADLECALASSAWGVARLEPEEPLVVFHVLSRTGVSTYYRDRHERQVWRRGDFLELPLHIGLFHRLRRKAGMDQLKVVEPPNLCDGFVFCPASAMANDHRKLLTAGWDAASVLEECQFAERLARELSFPDGCPGSLERPLAELAARTTTREALDAQIEADAEAARREAENSHQLYNVLRRAHDEAR